MQDFLPEVGTLNINYQPKLGVDVFPGNMWKAVGSFFDGLPAVGTNGEAAGLR